MLARFLGEESAADRVEGAVGAVLSKLGGTTATTMGHSTSEVGDLVAEAIRELDLPPLRHVTKEA
jgi:isocitrate/isopropylmalate dehydrogenase